MNRMFLSCLMALAVAAVSTTAWSDDTPAAADPAKTKVVCKKEAVMGTRIPQRVCKTQEQMDRDKEAMDQWAQEVKRNGSWSTVNSDH